jgi:hypothetical protein
LGFQLSGCASGFAEGFSFAARFGLGYTAVGPGKAPLARKIFINNATIGTPQKKGCFGYSGSWPGSGSTSGGDRACGLISNSFCA